ncbi:hypothetical protein M3J09_007234 [Ascochyta lentis]
MGCCSTAGGRLDGRISAGRLDWWVPSGRRERSCRCTLFPAPRIPLVAATRARRARCGTQHVPLQLKKDAGPVGTGALAMAVDEPV